MRWGACTRDSLLINCWWCWLFNIMCIIIFFVGLACFAQAIGQKIIMPHYVSIAFFQHRILVGVCLLRQLKRAVTVRGHFDKLSVKFYLKG